MPPNEDGEKVPEVPIAKDLNNLHPLVKQTRNHLHNQWSRKWKENEKIGSYLNAQISECSLNRALLFLDALVRGLENQGLKLTSDADDPKKQKNLKQPSWQRQERLTCCCWVECSGERVGFRLREKNKRVPLTDEEKSRWSFKDWKEVPSGQLVFAIEESSRFHVRTTWSDAKVQRIEKFLGEIVQCFEIVGKQMKERRIRREEQQRRDAEIEAIRHHHDLQRWREEKLANKMLHLAKAHSKAEILRQFLAECRSRMPNEKEVTSDIPSRTDLWFHWMETRADMIDPLKAGPMPWETRDFEDVIEPNLR